MDVTKYSIENYFLDINFKNYQQILLPPLSDLNLPDFIPDSWLRYIEGKIGLVELVDQIWGPVASFLPKTVAAIKKKTAQVCVLQSGHNFSLLYFFTLENEIRSRIAYSPIFNISNRLKLLDPSVQKLYSVVHNGFIDFVSKDAGFLPQDKIEIFVDETTKKNSFIKIFSSGTNILGFDISTEIYSPYIIWGSDEEIEKVDDFWMELDEWIADDLEGFDEYMDL